MSKRTKIAWCDSTWNWVRTELGNRSIRCVASDATFNAPLKWNKKPLVCDECGQSETGNNRLLDPICGNCGGAMHRRRVFSLSFGDWLDPKIPVSVLARALDIIRRCTDLDFLLLTKRPQLFFSRMSDGAIYRDIAGKPVIDVDWVNAWACRNEPPPNVWIGTSVEDQQRADERIPKLLKIPAKVRFLSIEPMLGPIQIPEDWLCHDLKCCHAMGIDWVIVGGESGPKARPCNIGWIRSIVRQCKDAGVPCFVKQLGSNPIIVGVDGPDGCDKLMRYRVAHPKGGDPAEWPDDLRVQEFPEVKS